MQAGGHIALRAIPFGEHREDVRALVCDGLGCLGLELDASLNTSARHEVIVCVLSWNALALPIWAEARAGRVVGQP